MANIISIDLEDYHNGPGVRVVVWFAGCEHKCPGCHNPGTWAHRQGDHLDDKMIESIIDSVDRDHIAGLTLSGGDPLSKLNRYGAMRIADAFQKRFNGNPNKTLWIWTGYKLNQLPQVSVVQHPAIDVIVDGKFVESKKNLNLKYRGSSNQKIWNTIGIECKDITNLLDKE